MADVNVRDLDDEVKRITDELARSRGMSTSGYIRMLLEQNAEAERRRRQMHAADERIARVRAELDLSRLSSGAHMVREARDEYEREMDARS